MMSLLYINAFEGATTNIHFVESNYVPVVYKHDSIVDSTNPDESDPNHLCEHN